jgi:hypothetical protein
MFVGRTLVLFSSPKLQKNMHNNDVRNDVYICCEIATMKEKKNYILEKLKHFKSPKKYNLQNIKCTYYNGHEKTSHSILLNGEVGNKDVISMLRLERLLCWNRNYDYLITKTSLLITLY